ncbi:MAG: hypothetical protein COV29_01675 [Candidatus Yanofskybacteria bacterium CG10_big_fil_rev_8_21_14_0_10_36_16]|uniref:Baseplate protein J-like domain-containing protein n=1 Tax=Candidatus Yanofskybacteria bacterium CG10_big_fil_rev_8_21_14_0_10_36_16 TaxID=1975096 RepID=A0A2J0QAY8_9BACT|nr:MAG: hypothetical protein COV29_01675 [Candidatus Yanofskybacteria bacterium CG10_big_fil_rev_8_21_14_0_10_36_16]
MSGTKVINVSAGDTFEEIISALKDSTHGDADEVILILPKGLTVLQDETRMAMIKDYADKTNVQLTIMTGEQQTAQLAMETGVEVMFTQKKSPNYTIREASIASPEIPQETDNENQGEEQEKEDFESEDSEQEDNEENSEDPLERIVSRGAGRFKDEDVASEENENAEDQEGEEDEEDESEQTEEDAKEKNEDLNELAKEPEQTLEKKPAKSDEEDELNYWGRAASFTPIEVDHAETEEDAISETIPQAMATLVAFKGNPLHNKVITDIIPPEQKYSGEKVKPESPRPKKESVIINSELKPKPSSRDDEISKLWLTGGSKTYGTEKFGDKMKKFNFQKPNKPTLQKTNLIRKISAIAVTIAVLALGTVLYIKLGSVKIVINPKKQPLDFEFKASALTDISATNYALDQVPGQKFEETKEVKGAFTSSGNKEVAQKARGEITIYNTSGTSQRLVATTRFESPEGLIFRIPVSIVVPAREGDTPGSIKVEIVADKAGNNYNIGPARFTIPGFEGKSKFTEFYAESEKPMIGGMIGPSPVVTETDLAEAQIELSTKLKNELEDSIKNKIGDLKTAGMISIKISEPDTLVESGTAVATFEMSVSGTASVIAFREDDIVKIIETSKIGEDNFKLLEDKTLISYTEHESEKDENKIGFTVKVNGESAYVIDKNEILEEIKGMKESQVRDYFSNFNEIEKAKITLSPFWVNEIPTEEEKIEIVIDNNK